MARKVVAGRKANEVNFLEVNSKKIRRRDVSITASKPHIRDMTCRFRDVYRGSSPIRNRPPPSDLPRTQGIGLR